MGIAPRSGYQDLVLGMEIMTLTGDGEIAYNTDWPIQRSWPVLSLNVLTYLAGAEDLSAGQSYPTGTIVTLRPGPQIPAVEVVFPDGKRRKFSVGSGGTVPFAETTRQGVYKVQADGQTVQSFSINLFSQRESDLRPVDGVDLGYDRVDVSQVAEAPLRRELWRWLLFGALGILIAEWVVYLRRVAV
jgi:hypothetical protein